MLSLTYIGNYSLRRYEFRGYSVLYAWISQVELKKFVVPFLIFEKYEKDTEILKLYRIEPLQNKYKISTFPFVLFGI